MRQKLGQHFLIDQEIRARILEIADIHASDAALEIGPGKGVLTRILARQAGQLIAIEVDPDLAEALRQAFHEMPSVHVLHEDARQLNYREVIAGIVQPPRRVKIVANLPYYAATPIVLALFQFPDVLHACTLMFQKEVAERIAASPGSKAYGSLSILCQYYSDVRYCFSVPPTAFRPKPKVDSAVVHLRLREQPPFDVHNAELFFQMVKCAFLTRRKTLKNALLRNMPGICSAAHLDEAFAQLNFSESIRAEHLSGQDFAALSNLIHRSSQTS